MSETFSPATTIAQYTIVSKLGEGGAPFIVSELLKVKLSEKSWISGR